MAVQVTLDASPTQEEVAFVHESLEQYNRRQTDGKYDEPGVDIELVLKSPDGSVVGGIVASTVFRVMHLEVLWVAREYRGRGFGGSLVLRAEQLGHQQGCIAAQTQTFSFQAPDFYRKLGYRLLGIYDGYPDGITEHTLMKRLGSPPEASTGGMPGAGDEALGAFAFAEPATREELAIVHEGLYRHVDEHVGAERDNPGIRIRLCFRDGAGQVVGGLVAWTTLRAMILDDVWLDERYRGRGLGTMLMTEAERIARNAGCIACQTHSFSFQAPEFLRKLGYDAYGVSTGYPHPVTETYFIKRF